MFSKKLFLIGLLTLLVYSAFCQPNKGYKQYRILILLDGSSSMVQSWNENSTRFQTAGNIILRLMDSVYHFNPNVEFALRVYGHQHGVLEKNCYDTKREVMFSKDNFTQMELRLADLHPIGVSPIAYSLKTAAEEDFTDNYNYAYSLILITDGGESCGGNICEVVQSLLDKKIQFKPYIVSLVDYAPLKNQYACLGNYMNASNPQQVNQTIQEIAENYHRLLAIPIAKTEPEKTPAVVIKKPTPIVPVSVPISVEKDTEKTAIVIKETPQPKPEKPQPVLPSKEKVSGVNATNNYRLLPENTIRRAAPKMKSIEQVALPAKEAAPIVLKKETVMPVFTNPKLRSFGLFWSTPTLEFRKIARISIPPKETTPTYSTPTTAPVKRATIQHVPAKPITNNNKKEIKTASFSVKTEPAQQTSLEIYFTDGKGKYYHTSPQIKLVDAQTGKELKKFYRTVDAQGNPDPQYLPAGNFTLKIGKDENFIAKAVTILPNNKNKITIIASNGTLSFKYTDHYSKPMDEFTALVKKNFEPGPIVTQNCGTEHNYEAGNYHIELNTLPISRRNLDIEFATDYIIEIDEPGFVSFTNTQKMGKVALYYQHGDMFSQFYLLDITGNPALQKVKLQPGPYEVHFKENGVFQTTMEKVIKFYIRSRETTEIFIQ